MVKINKQAFSLVGVTVEEYVNWCIENKRPIYNQKTKNEFFKLISDGRLVRDMNGRLVKKRKAREKKYSVMRGFLR